MGCDGGTIPRRNELVRQKSKPEQKDKNCERQYLWWHCALTQERLQEPIVMCGLGRLYCKLNIIERLLDKEKMPDSFKHIKSLKDVKDLKLMRNPESSCSKGDATGKQSALFICKLIGLEMSGNFKFIGLWSCGCVFSERALKQMNSMICPLCQIDFTENDVVVLNGNNEETSKMRIRMEARNKERKQLKRKHALAKPKDEVHQGPRNKTTMQKSIPSTVKNTLQDVMANKLECEYSVAKDPLASNVYKSIFTTHRSELEQTRAHWVTYNPFYN